MYHLIWQLDDDGPKLDPNILAADPASEWPGRGHGAAFATAGSTPLMEAAKRGNVGATKLLLDSGAKLELVDTLGRSCLHYAALAGGSPNADAVAEVREIVLRTLCS